MTTTFPSTTTPVPGTGAAPSAHAGAVPAPTRSSSRWPLFGLAGAVAGFASVMVTIPDVTEVQARRGISVVDQLESGSYRVGFLLGLVSVGCLLVAAAGWRRWAEERAPADLAARTVGQGLAVTATINVIFTGIMGAMAIYLPGGSDAGLVSRQHVFTNFVLLDFGSLLGWWGAAASAVSVAVLAFRRPGLLPRWMGVVSVLLLLPPVALAVLTGLPGFVGFTLPIWLAVVSIGMATSRRAHA